jgi:hypothetical protein
VLCSAENVADYFIHRAPIRRDDLREYAKTANEPELVLFCTKWMEASEPTTPIPPVLTHSGGQGRPSMMHLIEAEMRHRAGHGQLEARLVMECRVLEQWARSAHPELRAPTAKTIANSLRDLYRQLSQERPK